MQLKFGDPDKYLLARLEWLVRFEDDRLAVIRQDGFSALAIELGKAAKGLERKLTELQKGVMEIRMIPVGQLYEKMGRIVRKITREQGKKVDLKLYGADTELDKLIIEDIADPVMHIIRNSIDHGIEPPQVRTSRGKASMYPSASTPSAEMPYSGFQPLKSGLISLTV